MVSVMAELISALSLLLCGESQIAVRAAAASYVG